MNEIRIEIAVKLSEVRHSEMNFELPEAEIVLAQFYKLAIYCFNNFPIPESHQEYIDRHLEVNFTRPSSKKPWFFSQKNATEVIPVSEMTNHLIQQWENKKDNFSLELALRAVEVLFSYGHFPVTDEQYESVIRLINSLKKSILEVGVDL